MDIDPQSYVTVDFTDVEWPDNVTLPKNFTRNVRLFFLVSNDGNLFKHDDMKDVLKAWLQDEFDASPLDFKFLCCP